MTNKTDHWHDVLFRDGNTFSGTEGLVVPTGTTGQRPVTPASGLLRFNSSLSMIEGYDGTFWQPLTTPGGALTTIDALTDTPVSKIGFANRVMKIDNTQTVVEYSADLLIQTSGAVTVGLAYETLVTTDDVLTNKKFVDDSIAAIGTGPYVSRVTGGAMDTGVDFEMGSSSQILAYFGSASEPGYSFLGDTNTGIYGSLTDDLLITTGGTTRISVSDTRTDILNTLDLNGNDLEQGGNIDANTYTASGGGAQFVLPTYTVVTLPTGVAGGMIYVSDETSGAVPAFYDGANWLRVTDRAIVS